MRATNRTKKLYLSSSKHLPPEVQEINQAELLGKKHEGPDKTWHMNQQWDCKVNLSSSKHLPSWVCPASSVPSQHSSTLCCTFCHSCLTHSLQSCALAKSTLHRSLNIGFWYNPYMEIFVSEANIKGIVEGCKVLIMHFASAHHWIEYVTALWRKIFGPGNSIFMGLH